MDENDYATLEKWMSNEPQIQFNVADRILGKLKEEKVQEDGLHPRIVDVYTK